MVEILMAGALALLGGLPADTTVRVEPGTRVMVQNHQGSITVRAWDRNEVRVETPSAERVRVELRGAVLSVQQDHRRGIRTLDLALRVPAGSPLQLQGPFSDITVEGARERVDVQTVEGDVRIRDIRGPVSVHTVDGDIEAEDVTGPVQARTVDGDLLLARVAGDVTAETIDGNVTLRAVDARSVRATTVDGDVRFEGTLRRDAQVRLSAHDGDVVFVVPERTDATVSISTFGGEFRSSFPVSLQGARQGRRMEFVLGDGAARVELQSFGGEIYLLRPGESAPRRQ